MMKRYNKQFFKMGEADDGEWVHYESIQVAVAQNAEIHNEINKIKVSLNHLLEVTDARMMDLEQQIRTLNDEIDYKDGIIYQLQTE
jgi:hypothetical protein